MKYLVGFAVALVVMIIMHLIDEYIVKFKISEFFIGWVSCVGYFAGKDAYEERKHST